MKLLLAALQKRNYELAAYVLVYGLVKASVKNPRNSASLSKSRKPYGAKKKKQEKE